ncbi:MAG: hypothetical protein FWG30_03895 [Eubacteriaceae bacterium]|nr:hypothetical protein [Eubacteriaceae bacterium]
MGDVHSAEELSIHICPGCAGMLDIQNCGVYFNKMAFGDYANMPIFRRMTSRFAEIRSEFVSAYPNLAYSGMSDTEGAYIDAAIAAEVHEYFDGYNDVVFEISNAIKTAKLSQRDGEKLVKFAPISSSTPVCPNCGFVLPEDFFQRKVIYIGMIGASSSGKTVSLAVLARKDYACLNYTDRFKFDGTYTEADPGYFGVYKSIIEDINQGILPPGNQNFRIPPLLIKMDISNPAKDPVRYLIAIVDSAGEAFPVRERIGFLNYCSGYIVAIEAQSVYSDAQILLEGSDAQAMPTGAIAPYLSSEESQQEHAVSAAVAEKTVIKETLSTSYVLTKPKEQAASYSVANPALHIGVLNNINFSDTRHLAIVMTKADLIPESEKHRSFLLSTGDYSSEAKGRFVFDFDRLGKKSKLVQSTLNSKGITLNIDNRYNTAYFAVSATGKQPVLAVRGRVDRWQRDRAESVSFCDVISPINLYEPFMWLILNKLKDNGDLL